MVGVLFWKKQESFCLWSVLICFSLGTGYFQMTHPFLVYGQALWDFFPHSRESHLWWTSPWFLCQTMTTNATKVCHILSRQSNKTTGIGPRSMPLWDCLLLKWTHGPRPLQPSTDDISRNRSPIGRGYVPSPGTGTVPEVLSTGDSGGGDF